MQEIKLGFLQCTTENMHTKINLYYVLERLILRLSPKILIFCKNQPDQPDAILLRILSGWDSLRFSLRVTSLIRKSIILWQHIEMALIQSPPFPTGTVKLINLQNIFIILDIVIGWSIYLTIKHFQSYFLLSTTLKVQA